MKPETSARLEAHIDFEDHIVGSSDGSRYAPQPLVTWRGKLVHPVRRSTDALWAIEATWEGRHEHFNDAHAGWVMYQLEPPEFRDKWSFVDYALERHLDDEDEPVGD